jgi:hypothetical protein
MPTAKPTEMLGSSIAVKITSIATSTANALSVAGDSRFAGFCGFAFDAIDFLAAIQITKLLLNAIGPIADNQLTFPLP